MYRLITSERVVLDHDRYGPMVSYRHREVTRFDALPAAVLACNYAGRRKDVSCCILDDGGQEYFAGNWIA